jgi:adenylate cyclase, class 2
MTDCLETEVKFHLDKIDPVRNAILDLGATGMGRFFEINICFDDPRLTLRNQKALLRLRKDQNVTLTFKSGKDVSDRDVKVMKEIEVAVGDFEATRKILMALGFSETLRYEKWRETFLLGQTALLIDTLPFGDFLEIEGEKTQIPKIADRIGLLWETRILHNYLELFEALKTRINLPFNDLTFENFKHLPAFPDGWISRFFGPKPES